MPISNVSLAAGALFLGAIDFAVGIAVAQFAGVWLGFARDAIADEIWFAFASVPANGIGADRIFVAVVHSRQALISIDAFSSVKTLQNKLKLR